MATQQEISSKAGEIVGQAQFKKDEVLLNQESQGSNQNESYTTQASNFLQQTGEQVKSMAQGAAEAVKNTLGMNPESGPNTHISNANPPNNPSGPIADPSGPVASSTNHPSNPAGPTKM
ncbi:hypothetical protein Tsubulata_031571 [Turnera subulata]|uniref:Uncharacterized protein n=1 Tax=Turnera subulata TaxID=218843 RepID=A0A9Q0GHC8_9ROSI|nr:hypothetical protein Tsubulata_031571 [Turnera subulata]